ncbi:MAG: hypothetical protein FWD58_08515 [Firmicutes bacterium]|nr:hypothetical protein [Bacillota bacterium]
MKKLRAFIKKTLSSFTVTMSERPVLMTVLMFAGINIAILLVAAAVAHFFTAPGNYQNYFYALADAVMWLVVPNSVIDRSPNTQTMVLAAAVLIIGMVLFTGTIIAIITTYLRGYIKQRSEAKGKLNLSNHIVILNYNNEVTAMLIDLMYTNTDDTVLILSDKTKDFVKAELAAEKAMLKEKPKSKLRLIVRKGNPGSLAELQEISLERARGILIMYPGRADAPDSASINASDYDTIKLVMKLSNLDIPSSCPVGVEADTKATRDMVRKVSAAVPGLKNKSIQAFSHNRKLGQFLALSILCPPLSTVLTEVLSYLGCIFQPIEKTPTDECLAYLSAAIPIVEMGEKTYVLTADEKDSRKTRAEPFKTSRRITPAFHPARGGALKLFVIGQNRKSHYMLEALKAENAKMDVREYGTGEIERFCGDLARHGDVRTVAVILSDDSVEPEQYDANVFLTLIELSGLIDLASRPFSVIAEILEPDNQKSVEEFNIHNVIVSTRIISFFATKLLSDPAAEHFYEEIFSYALAGVDEKFDIWVDDAESLFDFSQNMSFTGYAEFVHAAYYGSGQKIMPLGLAREDKNIFFCTGLDAPRNFTLAKNDKIIYVEYVG